MAERGDRPTPLELDWAGRPLENLGPRIVAPVLAPGERLDAAEFAQLGRHPYLRQVMGGLLFGSVFGTTVRASGRRVQLPGAAFAVLTDRRFMLVEGSLKRSGEVGTPAAILLEWPRSAVRFLRLGGHLMMPAVYVDIEGRAQRLSFRYKRDARDRFREALSRDPGGG